MHAAAKITKASELTRIGPSARSANLIIPPFAIVPPLLENAGAVPALGRLRGMDRRGGSYSDWLVVRDNGGPEGTGKGRSMPFLNSPPAQLGGFRNTLGQVLQSNADAQDAIVQLLVGQRMSGAEAVDFRAPFAGGTLYTQDCTASGSAVALIGLGLPLDVVKGKAQYVAFNRGNFAVEAERLYPLTLLENTAKIHGVCSDISDTWIDTTSFGFGHNTLPASIHNEYERLIRSIPFEKIFRDFFDTILKIGERDGAVYMEWAMTFLDDTARFFILQKSNFEGKIPGFQTAERRRAERMADNPNAVFLDKRLSALFEAAMQDPQVIAAGYGAVGKPTGIIEEMIWLPSREKLEQLTDMPILVWNGACFDAENALRSGAQIKGFVEWEGDDGWIHAFIGHYRGLLKSRHIPGLSVSTQMVDKLYGQFPPGDRQFIGQKNLRIFGEFIFAPEEEKSFGSLRVLKITKVEPL